MSANLQTIEPQVVTPEILPSSEAFPLSAERKDVFLTTLVTTGGNVSKACRLLNISRTRVNEWRRSDPAFDVAWTDALEAGTENLEEIAYNRACATSDTLAIFLLKARRPNVYRENIKIDSEVSVNPDSANAFADSLIDRILQRKQEAARELAAADGSTT